MKVETFEVEIEQHPEACEEANRIIESLGLEGQKREGQPNTQRHPYRQWTAIEHKVYSILCPTHESVEQYAAQPIPLRVLQVLEHAKSLDYYTKFEVWHAASPNVKDPVLVACPPNANTWESGKFHILARWAEHLDEFPAMARQAAKLHKEALIRDTAKSVGRATAHLEAIRSIPDDDESILGMSAGTFYGD